ncbi:hypothetical protein FEM48_Zijuj06G0148200 [Ziziphus jujuba var. spinosa]|uniref:Uncharacterized protein n=1 Tax=Ziziphus jujuba var. spinosa TaxID=714518 RepID=A0A978V9X3_ZIZJJ|nr:hypothetical protein FEM48_Zijuj06G0148200 [Ziziphus jujuba var. spinosa]
MRILHNDYLNLNSWGRTTVDQNRIGIRDPSLLMEHIRKCQAYWRSRLTKRNCFPLDFPINSARVAFGFNSLTNAWQSCATIADFEGDEFGRWLRAELNAYTIVKEQDYLKRMEIPYGEIFDTFTADVNNDAKAVDHHATIAVPEHRFIESTARDAGEPTRPSQFPSNTDKSAQDASSLDPEHVANDYGLHASSKPANVFSAQNSKSVKHVHKFEFRT